MFFTTKSRSARLLEEYCLSQSKKSHQQFFFILGVAGVSNVWFVGKYEYRGNRRSRLMLSNHPRMAEAIADWECGISMYSDAGYIAYSAKELPVGLSVENIADDLEEYLDAEDKVGEVKGKLLKSIKTAAERMDEAKAAEEAKDKSFVEEAVAASSQTLEPTVRRKPKWTWTREK